MVKKAPEAPNLQKRLTNICMIRLKKCGKKFEVAAYRNTVVAWRNGSEKDIDEVLQVHTIFSNLSKGYLAKHEDLIEAFGTYDEDRVCVEVLNKGEFQMSEQERKMQIEGLFRDIASRVADMCVNPETQVPYPLTTIERALHETLHFAPSLNHGSKQQALQAMKALEAANVLPISRAKMRLRLLVPACRLDAALAAAAALEEGQSRDRLQLAALEPPTAAFASAASVVSVGCHAEPSLFRPLSDICRDHGGSVQVIELKANADAAQAAPPKLWDAAAGTIEHADTTAAVASIAATPAAASEATTIQACPIAARAGAAPGASGFSRGAASTPRLGRIFSRNLKNAENGDPVAQLEVGKAYLDGVGVARDEGEGRRWLDQAALQGVDQATKRLQAVNLMNT